MHQVIYSSEARPGLASDDVFRIIEQSARNNPSADITGFLVYSSNSFLQLIEGPLQSLETLLATLESDPRHHSLQVLTKRPVSARSFPRWRMKRIGETGNAIAELRAALAEEGHNASLAPEIERLLHQQERVRPAAA